jgi:ribonuclease R
VKLVEAAPVAGALRFELLSEGRFDSGRPRPPRSNERDADRARRGHHEAMARKSKQKSKHKSKRKSKFKGQRKSR